MVKNYIITTVLYLQAARRQRFLQPLASLTLEPFQDITLCLLEIKLQNNVS